MASRVQRIARYPFQLLLFLFTKSSMLIIKISKTLQLCTFFSLTCFHSNKLITFFFFLLFLPNSYVHFYTYKFLRNLRTVFPTTPPNQTLLALSFLEHFDFVAFGTSPLGLFFHHHHRQSRHHHYNERKQM